MIRVRKSRKVPASLNTSSGYNGEDVNRRLCADQQGKCYLCERVVTTDFHVEHLRSQNNYPARRLDWRNLFWSCSYCNSKKGDRFNRILNPGRENVERIIEQRIDYKNGEAKFASEDERARVKETMALLGNVYNGKGKMRRLREQRFFDETVGKMNEFQQLAADWLLTRSDASHAAVEASLRQESELLGFKYWVVMDNPELRAAFSHLLSFHRPSGQ